METKGSADMVGSDFLLELLFSIKNCCWKKSIVGPSRVLGYGRLRKRWNVSIPIVASPKSTSRDVPEQARVLQNHSQYVDMRGNLKRRQSYLISRSRVCWTHWVMANCGWRSTESTTRDSLAHDTKTAIQNCCCCFDVATKVEEILGQEPARR